jgi:polyhydroxyalkanoate synthase
LGESEFLVEAADTMVTGWQDEVERTARRGLKLLQICLEPPRVPMGAAPHREIYRRNKLRLLHYEPRAERIYPVPLLMVPSMINRYYILDLTPGRSLVEYLLSRGIDVYMLDWGEPGDEDAVISFDAYIAEYLDRVVKQVTRRSKSEQISLLGYCMGGTLTTIYTALRPRAIKNMVNLGAPIDFKDGGLLSRWTDAAYYPVDKLVETFGNVPLFLMQAGFQMLKPMGQLAKWVTFFEKVENEEFVKVFLAMEAWANDNVAFPGEAFRQFVKTSYQENLLCQNRLAVGGERVDLGAIACALLNNVAQMDHICAPKSASVLNELVASADKQLVILPGGHVGIVSGTGAKKYLWPTIGDWLVARSGEPKPLDEGGQ